MIISAGVEAALIAHARRESPHECCGLLLGRADAIVDSVPAENADPDPSRRYLVSPRDHFAAIRLARARGLEVIGAYHSHPRSDPAPSASDVAEAFDEFLYVIIGLAPDPPQLRAWRLAAGNFVHVPLVRMGEVPG